MVGSGQKNGRVLGGTLGTSTTGSFVAQRCRFFWGVSAGPAVPGEGRPAVRKAGVPIRMAAERLGSRVGGRNLREQRERVGAVSFLGEGAFPDKPALAHLSPPKLGVSWMPSQLPRPKGQRRNGGWLASLVLELRLGRRWADRWRTLPWDLKGSEGEPVHLLRGRAVTRQTSHRLDLPLWFRGAVS